VFGSGSVDQTNMCVAMMSRSSRLVARDQLGTAGADRPVRIRNIDRRAAYRRIGSRNCKALVIRRSESCRA